MEQDAHIKEEQPIVKTTVEARQGSNRAPMHYVLAGGMALVIVSFALMFILH